MLLHHLGHVYSYEPLFVSVEDSAQGPGSFRFTYPGGTYEKKNTVGLAAIHIQTQFGSFYDSCYFVYGLVLTYYFLFKFLLQVFNSLLAGGLNFLLPQAAHFRNHLLKVPEVYLRHLPFPQGKTHGGLGSCPVHYIYSHLREFFLRKINLSQLHYVPEKAARDNHFVMGFHPFLFLLQDFFHKAGFYFLKPQYVKSPYKGRGNVPEVRKAGRCCGGYNLEGALLHLRKKHPGNVHSRTLGKGGGN